jgi:hypothetical protein
MENELQRFKASIPQNSHEQLQAHHKSWAEYFQGSFISIPDKKIEANYWRQIYKIRAATRPGVYPIDLLGPWYRITPWPRIWCNLNIQVTYPFMNQANKPKVAQTLFDHMDKKQDHFIKAVQPEFQHDSASVGRGWDPVTGTGFWGEFGNYLWMLYNYSQFLNHFPDEERQKEKYYPMLKRGINFVLHHLTVDENGVYHFPPDVSPEYKVKGKGVIPIPDNNYNIGLLQWALKEAIFLGKNYSDLPAKMAEYQNVLDHLVPLQIDEKTGIMVGKGYTMDYMHRHFSHLISFYPLGSLDVNDTDDYDLIERSVERWLNRPKFDWGYKGYTYTAAAAMYSRLSKPEKALKAIHQYLDQFSTPNSFYLESGPVIETTLNSASATLEMLLQSFNPDPEFDEIRIFTSIPQSWKEASFKALQTQGGHTVSATYKNGNVESIELKAGSNATVTLLYSGQPLQVTDSSIQQRNEIIDRHLHRSTFQVELGQVLQLQPYGSSK